MGYVLLQHILELCRSEHPVEPQVILTQLYTIQPLTHFSNDVSWSSMNTFFLEE